MSLQAAVGVESPRAAVALELDVGDFRAVILVLRMELLEVPLGVELEPENGRAQVALISFDFLGGLTATTRAATAASPGRGGILEVHFNFRGEGWKTLELSMAERGLNLSTWDSFKKKWPRQVPNSSFGLC